MPDTSAQSGALVPGDWTSTATPRSAGPHARRLEALASHRGDSGALGAVV